MQIVSSTNAAGKTAHLCPKMNLDTELPSFTKIKWITGLNIKHKIIKLLEDNFGENLDDLEFRDDFLDIIPKAQPMKEKKEFMSYMDLTKINYLCFMKDTVRRMKIQP